MSSASASESKKADNVGTFVLGAGCYWYVHACMGWLWFVHNFRQRQCFFADFRFTSAKLENEGTLNLFPNNRSFIPHCIRNCAAHRGTEKFYRVNFQKKYGEGSILDVAVGFMGGKTQNPTYREVCRKDTGHVEVAQVKYDTSKVTYEQLVRFAFTFHDPTTTER